MGFYQCVIYDNEANGSNGTLFEDGYIIDFSQLFAEEETCRKYAQSWCEELAEEYNDSERFQYSVVYLSVIGE